jgi:predicted nucleotidyltransferase
MQLEKDKINKILIQKENIRFAYLFGSQVKNQTRFGSDLDIALYFEKEPDLVDIGALAI